MPETLIIFAAACILVCLINYGWVLYKLKKFRANLKPGQTVLIDINNRMIFARYISRNENTISVQLFHSTRLVSVAQSEIYEP